MLRDRAYLLPVTYCYTLRITQLTVKHILVCTRVTSQKQNSVDNNFVCVGSLAQWGISHSASICQKHVRTFYSILAVVGPRPQCCEFIRKLPVIMRKLVEIRRQVSIKKIKELLV